MKKLTLDALKGQLSGKRVLVRVDFNVPMDKKTGAISDDLRIKACLPTIKRIREEGGIPVLMSHMGRPKGERKPEFSLKPTAVRLGELLGVNVLFADDCIGPDAEKVVAGAGADDVVVLENLRYYKEETKNNPDFAAKLAKHGDVYVNDAFATAHRAHASTAGVTPHFPGKAAAGFLLQKELEIIGGALEDPKHPFVAIIGGAKISGKIDVIKNLMGKVDTLLVGGGMSNTFYKAMGLEIGESLLEEDKIGLAEELLAEVKQHPDLKFYLPMDCIVADAFAEDASTDVAPRDKVPATMRILDIGPETRKLYSQIVENAKLVVWNGPMGVFEMAPFAKGTEDVAQAVAKATDQGATTIIGGGDSASAIDKAGLKDQVSHISTGGGASLDMLGGYVLPGVDALTDV